MSPMDGGKRGPKTALTDDQLVGEIRAVLAACPFHSEGHRKVHFRLRAKDIRVGRKRVLRLMGEHHLLAPSRPRHEHGDPAHAGTIITTRPDEMWGTDATRFYTERELKRVQAKVGELTMKLEIVEWFLEKKGYGEELRKLKRSGEV